MKDYFVLYERDVKTEKEKKYGERMLFDNCKYFEGTAEAQRFAFKNLPAIFGKRTSLNEEDKAKLKDEQKPYIVAAKQTGKYCSSCMGETDYLETYDVIRCSENELETTIEKLAGENETDEIIAGLELKLV